MPNGKKNNISSQPARKRNRRRRTNALSNNNKQSTFRTTDNVQRSLAQRNNVSKPITTVNRRIATILDMDYLRCRLDPLNHSGGNGLNDGSASKKVVFDCRTFGDFTVDAASQQFIIKIVPWMPYPALIKTGSGATPNGFTVNGTNYAAGDSDMSARWIPLCVTQNAGSVAPAFTPLIPFAGGTYRLISMAWKLIYTGSAASCSGILTVKESPITVNSRGLNISTQTLQQYGGGVPVATYGVNSVPIATVTSTTAIATLTTDTHECRPEVGCTGVLRHINNIYSSHAIKNVTELPVAYNNDGTTGAPSFIAAPAATTSYGSICFYDNDYTPIEISGRSVSGSFRLELVQCFEVVPAISSTAILVAKAPGKDNRLSQELADQYLARAPVSIPVGTSHYQRFMQSIANHAGSLGSAFGPYGMAIGTGISTLASALSGLNL